MRWMLLLTMNGRSNSNIASRPNGGVLCAQCAGRCNQVAVGVQSSRQHLLDKRGLHPLKACHARFNAGDVGPSKARNS